MYSLICIVIPKGRMVHGKHILKIIFAYKVRRLKDLRLTINKFSMLYNYLEGL